MEPWCATCPPSRASAGSDTGLRGELRRSGFPAVPRPPPSGGALLCWCSLHRHGLVDLDGPAVGDDGTALRQSGSFIERVGRDHGVATRSSRPASGDAAGANGRRGAERIAHVGHGVTERAEPRSPSLHRLLLGCWILSHLTASEDVDELRHRVLLATARPDSAAGVTDLTLSTTDGTTAISTRAAGSLRRCQWPGLRGGGDAAAVDCPRSV